MKYCEGCASDVPLSNFYKNTERDKFTPRRLCKPCWKEKAWEQMIKRRYNISPSQYKAILKRQRGCCAVCGVTPETSGSRLCVDHCHKTGVVRGLLCGSCNKALGLLGDNSEGLRRALRYLEESKS